MGSIKTGITPSEAVDQVDNLDRIALVCLLEEHGLAAYEHWSLPELRAAVCNGIDADVIKPWEIEIWL